MNLSEFLLNGPQFKVHQTQLICTISKIKLVTILRTLLCRIGKSGLNPVTQHVILILCNSLSQFRIKSYHSHSFYRFLLRAHLKLSMKCKHQYLVIINKSLYLQNKMKNRIMKFRKNKRNKVTIIKYTTTNNIIKIMQIKIYTILVTINQTIILISNKMKVVIIINKSKTLSYKKMTNLVRIFSIQIKTIFSSE